MPVAVTPAFETRATTAVDTEDRVCVAWEFGPRHWGKDNGRALADPGIGSPLGGFREPRIACLAQGRWLEPVSPLEAAFRPSNTCQPHVYSDGSGSIRVVAMERRTGGPTRDSVLFRKRAYPEYWRGRPDGYWSYWWWYSQKMSDMYHLPGTYINLFAHERSASYPFGHRNVFYSDRAQAKVIPFFLKDGVSLYAFPLTSEGDEPADEAGFLAANDTEILFQEVRARSGIIIVHTPGSGMGTDWRHRPAPDVEPVVEIFQGARRSFEHVGAPYSWTQAQVEADAARVRPDTGRISDWIRNLFRIRADGMVSEAWKRGHKLGVIASSDHVSTHISYAMVYTRDASRKGLLEAIRKRHTYGATDNIVLEARMGEHFMGDEFQTEAALPVVVEARGTALIKRVDLLKDGEVIHSVEPGIAAGEWEFPNTRFDLKPHFYYVRLLQEDGMIAWSSPFFVNYPPARR